MKLADYLALTAKIAQNLDNQGLVTELLTQLNEDYTQESTLKESLLSEKTEYDERIKQLQKTNMQLFLKQGNPVPDEKLSSTKPLEYDDLIKDMEDII